MQHAVERERARIARDIHDDVGASLTEISLLSEFAQNESAPAEQVKADVQRIAAKARGSTQALDEIVWAVNPRNDTLDAFANYACTYAEEQMRLAGIRCRMEVPPTLPSLPLRAVVRHHLFLAFKEALNNVVRHARASEAQIRISVEPERFNVVVADNGCGFLMECQSAHQPVRNNEPQRLDDPCAPAIDRSDDRTPPRGDGLVNMKERLEEIGGTFECESTPGNGTRVRLSVRFG
jgi:signal transduction histidine kinase